MVKFVDVLVIIILDDLVSEYFLRQDEDYVFVLFLGPRVDRFRCLEWVRVLSGRCCWFSGFICGLWWVNSWVGAIEVIVVVFRNCEVKVSQCVGLV